MFRYLKKLILLGGDLVFLNLALFLTLFWRYGQGNVDYYFRTHWPRFLVVFAIWLIVFYINDLYNLNLKINSRRFLLPVLNSIIFSSLFSTLYFYLNVDPNIAPKTNLLIFTFIFIVLFLLWRSVYQAVTHSLLPKGNLAIVGNNDRSQELIKELKDNPIFEYQIGRIFKNSLELEKLSHYIKTENITAIVVVDDFDNNGRISQILFDCLKYKITFFSYPDLYELLTGKIPVEAIDPDWFLTNLREGQKSYFNLLKRIIDLILAFTILIISLPAWPLIALLIKLSSPGPLFFKQMRLSLNGQAFKIIKFRTMRTEEDSSHKLPNDRQRITKFGLFIRQTRIDEIPQVLNVIRNEMSFIGPRPERLEVVVKLEQTIPFYRTRLLVKPGLSGWDQISGKYHSSSQADSLEKLQYDLYYLKHRSLYLDLSIALKTIATMLSRQGK